MPLHYLCFIVIIDYIGTRTLHSIQTYMTLLRRRPTIIPVAVLSVVDVELFQNSETTCVFCFANSVTQWGKADESLSPHSRGIVNPDLVLRIRFTAADDNHGVEQLQWILYHLMYETSASFIYVVLVSAFCHVMG